MRVTDVTLGGVVKSDLTDFYQWVSTTQKQSSFTSNINYKKLSICIIIDCRFHLIKILNL